MSEAGGSGINAARVAMLIHKQDMVVVCHWATKGKRGRKEPEFVRLDCLVCLMSNHIKSQSLGGGQYMGTGKMGGTYYLKPCLDH